MLRNLLLLALLCNIALSQVCTTNAQCVANTTKCCTTTSTVNGVASSVSACLPVDTPNSDNTATMMGVTAGVKVSCNAKYILSSVMMAVLAVAAIFV